MKKVLAVIVTLTLVFTGKNSLAAAGWIATNVEIDAVTNTRVNGQNFQITVSAGDGSNVCEGSDIWFPLSDAGTSGNDKDILERAFSIALTALTTGKKVSIYTYDDNTSCGRAAYIKIIK